MLCDTVPRVGPGQHDFACSCSWRTAPSTPSTPALLSAAPARLLIREDERAEQQHRERRDAESHDRATVPARGMFGHRVTVSVRLLSPTRFVGLAETVTGVGDGERAVL